VSDAGKFILTLNLKFNDQKQRVLPVECYNVKNKHCRVRIKLKNNEIVLMCSIDTIVQYFMHSLLAAIIMLMHFSIESIVLVIMSGENLEIVSATCLLNSA